MALPATDTRRLDEANTWRGSERTSRPGTAGAGVTLPLVGNAATTATLNSLPPGVPGLPGQGFLAGQGTVGNAAVASGAVAAPRGPVAPGAKKPTAAVPRPGAVKAKAPTAPAPEKQGRADQPAEQQPEKTKGKGKGKADAAATRRSPGADPKFQALKKDVATKKRVVGTTHPPARTEAVAAQAAAVPPADDQEARGKAAHAEDMDAAQPKEFNKEAFVAAVEKAIADRAPKNLDEADKFGDSGKAEEVKQEVQGKVGEGKQTSAQEIADTTAQPPQPAPDAKPVVAMEPDRPPGKPAGPNANQAVPDTLPTSATDMSAGPEQVDRQMADAKVTEPQLARSNEPTFKAALADKKTMDEHSATAPAKLRGAEAQEIKSVKNNAAALGPPAMTSMAGTRIAAGQQVAAGKSRAKGSDEEKRTTVTALLQKVFDKTKTDVEKILSDLDTTVDSDFTREEKLAREKFTREHTQGMEDYKDRRYSGVLGKGRWVKDLFADLPEEANRIYERAKANYLTAMRQVITGIAGTVERELRRAKDRIAEGRKELKAAVDKLPKDLQAIGRQAAGEFADKFDELRDTVNDKGTELVDTLATKYTEAVQEVDKEIAAEKEKNKGLVSKAKDAVAGAIKAIMELKELLMGVLSKAVQAIGMILTDPIGFLGKLVTAVGGGLELFKKNIDKHMQQGALTWLLGTGSSAGVQIPAKFDVRGILLMIASLLGISWANIRSRIARKVPDKAVTAAETSVPLVSAVKRQGVAGAWDDLKTRVGDLKKDLVDRLIKYLTPTIVIAGITWILSLLNPASAFIRACKMIIDIVRFIVTQARQIIDFVNAVLDAVIAIARGGASGVPAMVEQALARAIPVLIGALAAILGIGGIAGKVRQIFQQLARPVNRAIDWVIDKITGLIKKLWAKIKPKPKKKREKKSKPKTGATTRRPKRRQPPHTRKPRKPGKPRGADGPGNNKSGKRQDTAGQRVKRPTVHVPFQMAGESHTLTFKPSGTDLAITMASQELPLTKKFQQAHTSIDNFKHYMSSIEDPTVKELYEMELLPKIIQFQAPAVSRFKKIYEDTFPKEAHGVPLGKAGEKRAADRVRPLITQAEQLLDDIKKWAATTGIQDLSAEEFDKAVRTKGGEIWLAVHAERKAKVEEVISTFDYKGEPIQYRGSLKSRWKGPHKGKVRFDPQDFDVDMYVIHTEDFERIERSNPTRVQAGKVFPSVRDTPELVILTRNIKQALIKALPGVARVGDSDVVLRKVPPQ
ncbi:HPC2 multi-domain protein [Streptomyces sp. NPDC052236]|uniref:HPC2 multi-domain protein n=1 Tax=Streptomyces sp. NPDC052236 TaxID=3365686 RepID=UPI0037CDFE90